MTGSAKILPVQVIYLRDKNRETKGQNKFCFSMSYNKNKGRKKQMTIRILLSKVVGNWIKEIRSWNSIFSVVEKWKTKMESRIPFSANVDT